MRLLLFFFLIALVNFAAPATDSVCDLPRDPGPCRAYIPMYYFDNSTNTCEPFVYGGCQGNDNRFEKLRDCQKACVC